MIFLSVRLTDDGCIDGVHFERIRLNYYDLGIKCHIPDLPEMVLFPTSMLNVYFQTRKLVTKTLGDHLFGKIFGQSYSNV